jgi:electron transfer flavoprotein beta subunit
VRKALAMGADDALLLSDAGCAGSDVWGTAYALAAAIKKYGFDLVVHRHAIDRCGHGRTARRAGRVSGRARVDLRAQARTRRYDTVRVERETDAGYQKISAPLPALVSVTKSANEPRYPSLKGIMGAKKKTIAALTLAELALDRPIGGDGAKTELIALADPPARGKARIVEAADGADGARIIVEFFKEKKLI